MGSLVGKPGGHADAQQLKQGVDDRQAVDPAGRVSNRILRGHPDRHEPATILQGRRLCSPNPQDPRTAAPHVLTMPLVMYRANRAAKPVATMAGLLSLSSHLVCAG